MTAISQARCLCPTRRSRPLFHPAAAQVIASVATELSIPSIHAIHTLSQQTATRYMDFSNSNNDNSKSSVAL